jgi:cytochrome b561
MAARYDRTARTLHWLVALLLLGQLIFGWWLGEVPRNTPLRGYAVNLHKSTGLVIGLLVVLRVVWRLRHPAPPWPDTMPAWQRRLAVATHHLLYVLMLLVPLAGYLASNFSKFGVKFFNVVTLPPWGPEDRQIYALFNLTHKVAVVLLVALLAAHVGAALMHALRRDGVFARIWLRPF